MSSLTIKRGDTFRRDLAITEPDGDEYVLTGATVWFTVKAATDRSDNDDDALIKLYWVSGGASSGITVDDPETGVITVEMTPDQTDALTVSHPYRYDVQVLNVGKVDTPIVGDLSVTRDVTRRITV